MSRPIVEPQPLPLPPRDEDGNRLDWVDRLYRAESWTLDGDE